jgi:hypothetical protein
VPGIGWGERVIEVRRAELSKGGAQPQSLFCEGRPAPRVREAKRLVPSYMHGQAYPLVEDRVALSTEIEKVGCASSHHAPTESATSIAPSANASINKPVAS